VYGWEWAQVSHWRCRGRPSMPLIVDMLMTQAGRGAAAHIKVVLR
jgi:hypothetical protein